MDFRYSRPQHVVLVHVIPKHLIDTNFENRFEIWIYRFRQYARDAKLIDVETRSVTIVKDLWMPEAVNRWAVEIFL
jgi:hypothetical protein